MLGRGHAAAAVVPCPASGLLFWIVVTVAVGYLAAVAALCRRYA